MKVFLGSIVTYQLVYWIWAKLETDEIKDKKRSEYAQVIATHTINHKNQQLTKEPLKEKYEIWKLKYEDSETSLRHNYSKYNLRYVT